MEENETTPKHPRHARIYKNYFYRLEYLTKSEMAVYCVLAYHAGPNKPAFCSIKTICKITGMSRRNVYRAIKELVRERTKDGKINPKKLIQMRVRKNNDWKFYLEPPDDIA